jgi:hypothetical protein
VRPLLDVHKIKHAITALGHRSWSLKALFAGERCFMPFENVDASGISSALGL